MSKVEEQEYDLIKMPHHGEYQSVIKELIDAVNPDYAIITDSIEERASKKTYKLLDENKITTYESSSEGTIVIRSNGNGKIRVDTNQ